MNKAQRALVRLFEEPRPVRRALLWAMTRLKLGPYPLRVRLGAVGRPHYAHCVLHAARLARRLALPRISVIEFGVAGGCGLLYLEAHAREAERETGVTVEVFGFDTGEGLPPSTDYRDLPYHWQQGFFRMDAAALKARLHRARLVLGRIEETAARFFQGTNTAPVGAIAFALDYYSSTVAALSLFDAGPSHFLPRVFCYLDDVIGSEVELYGDFTGVRLAVREFNERQDAVKLSPAYHLFGRRAPQPWHHQIQIAHFFRHPQYGTFVSGEDQQLAL